MNALKWTRAGRLELIETAEPVIAAPTQVKLRIELTGICGTDLAVIAGKEEGVPDVTRGHEAVGTVVEIGSGVRMLKPGDRVVIDPNWSCGRCEFCAREMPNLCIGAGGGMAIAGLNTDGTFAPYYVSEEKFVHRLPDDMSWERGVLVEPLACVLHNFQEAQVKRDDAVLVLGSGPMGLLCQMVSRETARLTVATELNPGRLRAAAAVADAACRPDELAAAVDRVAGGRRFDVVIDAVGNQMETAERWIGRGGRIVPFGINAAYRYTIAPVRLVQQGVSIIGAGEYRCTFPLALRLARTLPGLERLVTGRYGLEQHERAVRELLGYDPATGERVVSDAVKTVFEPWARPQTAAAGAAQAQGGYEA